ncbi:TonB-dependent receptor [Marinoscillum furvescens]|uniref:Iron complex outermembrane receptor protein n=1 Tax=Marinoscillum furvescens DSM 4134 TaxID=1122208 RepID=A0A3D9L0S9_MARFU|nr:TonB-dependent receptor [Marinoscillum furvescens]RED94949.1 iron complex outermembrane receptor protein [Marinoscillum furvescens DSM 4134]
MKKTFTILIMSLLFISFRSYSQSTVQGRVMDADSGQPLIGATAMLEGTSKGATTDTNGTFAIQGVEDGTYSLTISYVGYSDFTQKVTVDGADVRLGELSMAEAIFAFDQVVVSGTRQAEKVTETPATIEIISSKDLEELPSFNPGELLARVKGVDFIRAGVVGTGINIRGFNSNFNAKNLQVNDGRFATLIATGLPMGPLTTQIKEDVERVEVILGPNAALYGPNAHNGLVHTITKDPRTSQGTTIAVGAGNQSMFTARMRHAQVLSDKFSFKVTGEYTRAEEFEFTDSVYIDRKDAAGNMGADGVKEGYEEYMLDNDLEFLRAEAALYYSVSNTSDLIFSWGGSNSTYLSPTNVGRNQIKDWRMNQFHLRYTSDKFFAQVYHTKSKTDDTYAIDQRTKNYYAAIDGGATEAEARESSLGNGATFADDSKRWNAEVQYHDKFGDLGVVIGSQWQRDHANSNGTYLLDNNGEDPIIISQVGVYGQLDYQFTPEFKATAAFRGDNHEVYGFNFIPKSGLVYAKNNNAFRFTYGKGIAAPTILNMYGDLFAGLILGNAEGFTLNDGTKVEKQKVEQIQTFEVGYKGELVPKRFFVDANAYYNISRDFLSPVTIVGVATERGDTPMEEVQSGYSVFGGLVATYVNFGKVNTYGFDIGTNLYLSDRINWTFNYSYFDYTYDEDDLENNDFNNDGEVNKLDVLVNAPKNKFGTGVYYRGNKFFSNIYIRWVQEYDYFSSYQIAAKTQDLSWRGTPVVENARSTDAWNYGPLGGFVNVDFGLGYRVNNVFTVSGQVTNLFNAEYREFTAAPFTGRLFSIELKANLPAIGN